MYVCRKVQGDISGLKLTHNSTIYITVMATNAAGLTTVSHGQPIIVDLTPPIFSHIGDGPGGKKRGDDIMAFRTIASGQSIAMVDIRDALNTSAITVYSTVRCFNKAGLVVATKTDGVEIVKEKNKISLQELSVLSGTQSESIYSRGVYHQDQNIVRFHWSQADRQLRSTVVEIVGHRHPYQDDIPNHLQYTYATLSNVNFETGSACNVSVVPVDIFGATGEKTTSYFTVPTEPPTVADSRSISLMQNDIKLTASWKNMFVSPWNDLDYEVHGGTLLGGADIVDRMLTNKEEIVLRLNSRQAEYISVMITAIDVCGACSQRAQRLKVKQD
ncbi:uncharacterized protein [Haliotis asinina]|uniref:uncharacterized protein n=1 Tax=Haliotis asinina TaxID=109174 RepID=UPI003531B975